MRKFSFSLLILNVGDNENAPEDEYNAGNAPEQAYETETISDNNENTEEQGFIRIKGVILISCICLYIYIYL